MENKLIIVDDFDNIIGFATKKEINEKKLNYRAVHIFLFNAKRELLIAKRPKNMKTFPSIWTSGSGGKVDEGETYEQTAHRELKEELGIDVVLKEWGDFMYIHEKLGCKVFHKLFVGYCSYCHLKPAPEEIEELQWVTIDWVRKDIENNPKKYAYPFIAALESYIHK